MIYTSRDALWLGVGPMKHPGEGGQLDDITPDQTFHSPTPICVTLIRTDANRNGRLQVRTVNDYRAKIQ